MLLSVRKFLWVAVVVCVVVLGAGVSLAAAEEAHPGWEVFGRAGKSVLAPGGEGRLILYVYNVGGANSGESATVTDVLPAGLEATGLPGNCSSSTDEVVCKIGSLPAGGPPEKLFIPVKVVGDPTGTVEDSVTVSGGGALGEAKTTFPVRFGTGEPELGLSKTALWISNAEGKTGTQAGSHPYELTFAYAVNTAGKSQEGEEYPAGGEMLDLEVKLPPGIIGNPTAVPRCTRAQYDDEIGNNKEPGSGCPADTQVGIDRAELSGNGLAYLPLHNLAPPPGVAAQFAFNIDGINVFLDARVRSGGDYGITEHVDNIPNRQVTFNSTTIWGVPSETSHDPEREGEGCIADGNGQCGSSAPLAPFLTLPTSCVGSLDGVAEIHGTWEDENARASQVFTTSNELGVPEGFTGCERLVHFAPTLSVSPDTSFSDTPAGLTATVRVPQGVNPETLATSGLRDTTVVLPEGVVINPGQATGLQACQPYQENIGGVEAEDESEDGPPSCPAASKVGTDEISTPILPDTLKGNIYTLQSNPPNLQLMVAASGDGVNLKLIGEVHLNETTGQLTTTFLNTPDTPVNEVKLAFSGGPQAALATPTRCGVYESTADFTPWSTPFVSDALDTSRFQITAGPSGSGCVWPMPFSPVMTAGATTDQAGGYTDFTMLLQRADEQQRIGGLQFKAPEGLLGMLSTVALCREPQASTGTCSSASQIGHTVATAGPGPYPFEVPQAGGPPAPIYLTGPYEGAPFGLSIVVPVVAGPFNLGTVVIRAKIEVDSHTAQITVTANGLPEILDGIPTDLRAIDAVIDRPGFMFNPTSCAPMSFSGTATSYEGSTASLASHFQVGSCQALKFKPDFQVSTSGKTSRANGANLTAKIVYPTGNLGANQASSQSNINSVKVDLPKQLPSRLTTLQKACPARTFETNPASCPADSIVGHARALTPVLPVSLEGPAYFVSHAGEEFPNLIVVLQGENVTVDLVGDTFISKAGITSSTFRQVPDVPIGLFELVLPQGRYSALAANTNLCKSALSMPTAFVAQNGAVIHQTTKVTVTGCPKTKKTKTNKAEREKAKPRKKPRNGLGRVGKSSKGGK